MTAGEAITLLIHGHIISREAWASGGRVKRWSEESNKADHPPRDYFRYDSDVIQNVEWTPTHADLTAHDWAVLPDGLTKAER